MSEPFLGEIRVFAGNFAPSGWAFCDGSLLPISENDALYALIGTTYGGDGVSTFRLPDVRGRSPLHQGKGPRVTSNHVIGEQGGVEEVTLTALQMPAHSHQPTYAATATSTSPAAARWAAQGSSAYSDAAPAAQLAADALMPAGGGQSHENMLPFLAVSYIIALTGIFPSQG